jgi:hypothetical protein
MPECDAYLMVDWSASSRPLGSNGTLDAVKVHRPRDWASRGDDFGVKHRNNFVLFAAATETSLVSTRSGWATC